MTFSSDLLVFICLSKYYVGLVKKKRKDRKKGLKTRLVNNKGKRL